MRIIEEKNHLPQATGCQCVCVSQFDSNAKIDESEMIWKTDWLNDSTQIRFGFDQFFSFLFDSFCFQCVWLFHHHHHYNNNKMNTLHSSIRSSINYYTILNESFFLSLQSRFFFWQFQNNCCGSIYQSINQWWWWRRRRCSRQKRNVSLLEIFSQSTNPEFLFWKIHVFLFALDHICCWITYHGQRWKENHAYVFDFWQVIIEWWLFNMIKHY